MTIKAVFFDIDGTLLNDRKNVQKTTQKAIQSLKKQGILVGLATGRGPAFVQPFLENFGLDFAVTYNGQYILTRDKILYQNQLPKSLIYKVIRYASDKKKEVSLGTASGLAGSRIIDMGTSSFGQVISSIVPKSMVTTVEGSFKHLIRRVKPQSFNNLVTIMREPIYQIVMVASAEETQEIKGIERLGAMFGFELSEVMAFGDSDNDIEMLRGVGVGVAMGNADELLKADAHFITASNNNGGISKALAHYGLIHLDVEKSFKSRDENFNKVKDFHRVMDGDTIETPKSYTLKDAGHRADFKVEELVEFLFAASQGDKNQFTQSLLDMHSAIDRAAIKVQSKEYSESPLVGQVDALTDLLYFTYGSFVLMGVDPQPIFETVHEANMGKLFPDGKAHFDPVTHKILKPANWEKHYAPEKAIKKELDKQLQKSLQRLEK